MRIPLGLTAAAAAAFVSAGASGPSAGANSTWNDSAGANSTGNGSLVTTSTTRGTLPDCKQSFVAANLHNSWQACGMLSTTQGPLPDCKQLLEEHSQKCPPSPDTDDAKRDLECLKREVYLMMDCDSTTQTTSSNPAKPPEVSSGNLLKGLFGAIVTLSVTIAARGSLLLNE